MPDVPQFKKPMPEPSKSWAMYCFRPSASEADRRHDIRQIEQFIEHIKSKKKKRGGDIHAKN